MPPLSHDETTELTDVYKLMTAEELRGQLGEDEDHDALINSILGDGKAVELEGGPAPTPEEDDADPDADDDDPDEDDVEPDEDNDPEPAPAPAAAEVPAPAAEAAAPAVDVPAADIPPLDLSYLAEKFDTKLSALDEANATSLAKLMSGEIEAADYAKAQAQYLRDRDALRDQKAMEAEWGKEVHNFQVQSAKETGINYFTDTEKGEALDAWVKHLAQKDPTKDGAWYLREAHKKVMVEFNIAAPTPKAAAKPAGNVADGKKVSQKTARTPNLSAIPPTLSGLPAAAPAASGDGGEFDHLYKLMQQGGPDYEMALARMSAEQQARFLAE